MRRMVCMLLGAALWNAPASPRAAATARIMSLDGESAGPYHRWQVTTPVLNALLTETGLFTVDVVTTPAATGELSGFQPSFAGHGAIVMNYDAPDERWPAAVKSAFE